MNPRLRDHLSRHWPSALAVLTAWIAVMFVKYQDVKDVRKAVPDLGVWESAFWPLYDVRDGLRFGEMSEAEARCWVEAMRNGNREEAERIVNR